MAKARKELPRKPPSKTAPTAPTQVQRWRVFGICIVLGLITFAVFGQTLGHEFVDYDDNAYVYENSAITHGLTLKGVASAFDWRNSDNWVPLTTISHMLDCQVFGLNAGGHHLTNVLLHSATVILLFLALRLMTGALWRSAFVAAVFAIHPLRVESVAWIAERKDVLSGVFFMLTLWAYVVYVRSPKPALYYLAALFTFTLGLMSKPTLVTLPFVLLLLDYWPLNRFKLPAPDAAAAGAIDGRKSFSVPWGMIIDKVPFLVLSAGACIMTSLAERAGMQPIENYPLHLRIENAVVSYVIHIKRMIYPANLSAFYPYPHHGLPPWEVAVAGTLLAGISALALTWRRTQPWLLVGWLWYLGMLVPMIGFIQVGAQAQADRHTYLPQIGIYFAVTWLAAKWTSKWQPDPRVIGACMVAVVAMLTLCASKQTTYWKNSEKLWAHTLDCTTDNFVANNILGLALYEKGDLDGAIKCYHVALQINPNYAEAYNNLGLALLEKGDVDAAITELQKSLEINPRKAEENFNLGNAYYQKGRMTDAISCFQKALQIKPRRGQR